MPYAPTFRFPTKCVSIALLLLLGATEACALDSYDPASRQLTIPSLQIGSSTYTNIVVTVGDIVSGSMGSAPNASQDTYDPGSNQVTVQAVTAGSSTYYNVVATVAGLISIGDVTPADTYNGSVLNVSAVQAGGAVYGNVVVTLGSIVRVAGGMPTAGPDTYNATTHKLAVPAVRSGGHVYTNVVVTVDQVQSVGGVSFRTQESILHSLSSRYLNGVVPNYGLTQGSDGNFYGLAIEGGAYNQGAVYKVTPAGVETVLHSFGSGPADANNPQGALVQGLDGNLYGTSFQGGTSGNGTVYRVTPAGVETVLYSFSGGTLDGGSPQGALTLASDGNFYGATTRGGTTGNGTIFRITLAGAESIVYSFSGGTQDGSSPNGGLILDSSGNIYGTTLAGGANNGGTLVRITPAGLSTVLHSFTGGTVDGFLPLNIVWGSDGNIYGVTLQGGALGNGTFFKVTPAGVESLLYSFGFADSPTGTLIQGRDGDFYATASGGDNSGTFFRLTAAGVATILYPVGTNSGTNLFDPNGGLIQGNDGNFYAITRTGGVFNLGAILQITPTGVGTVLYSFGAGSADGAYAFSTLIVGSDGNFYGTTWQGGSTDNGAVIKITPGGIESVLYSFGGAPTDGSRPNTLLSVGSDGNFFGTTVAGGTNGGGTLFKVTPAGVESVLYSYGTFDSGPPGDGANPIGAPVQGSDGNFYVATELGGAYGKGTVSRVTPEGAEIVLYSFGSSAADGANPVVGLTQGKDGELYGMTESGIFKISAAGDETTLHTFVPGTSDGNSPGGALIQGSDGNFYGTTMAGGTSGTGTVFRVTPDGSLTILYSFGESPTDGTRPTAGLLEAADGNFYGTTSTGGTANNGTVFQISPNGVETLLYSFGVGAEDATTPSGGLVQGSDGSFYGTTSYGGTYNSGAVFSLMAMIPVH